MNSVTRRTFMAATAATGTVAHAAMEKPAVLGGSKVRTKGWPKWPVFDKREEDSVRNTLLSGNWFRGNGKNVAAFEAQYAQLTGSKGCLAARGWSGRPRHRCFAESGVFASNHSQRSGQSVWIQTVAHATGAYYGRAPML